MSTEQENTIEEMIQSKGLTAPRIKPSDVDDQIVTEDYYVFPGTCQTICLLTLKNGYTVTGESACASPANFDADVGRDVARKNAREKIWGLEGYALRNKASLVEQSTPLSMDDLLFKFGDPKTYIGTKVVYAVPMSRQTYNDLRSWELPSDENGDDPGYLVMYADGGAKNVDGFGGYVSWSPQDVFEQSYEAFDSTGATYADRLRKEYAELNQKIGKLEAFLVGDTINKLPEEDQKLLKDQLGTMVQYCTILSIRLSRV
jgi:hypothetical protein